MIAQGFTNAKIAPCLFIKQEAQEFVIIAIYVDDLNIFGKPSLTPKTIQILKTTFKMHDLGPPNLCLGIQIDYLQNGVFISQSTYIQKILRQFNMETARQSGKHTNGALFAGYYQRHVKEKRRHRADTWFRKAISLSHWSSDVPGQSNMTEHLLHS